MEGDQSETKGELRRGAPRYSRLMSDSIRNSSLPAGLSETRSDPHQAPERDEQERKEYLDPLHRQGHRNCPFWCWTPEEEERSNRDVPDHEADPEPAELRRGPLRHHSEARMSRKRRGAATPEDPHGPESKQCGHRPPPREDVGVPAPRLEEVE